MNSDILNLLQKNPKKDGSKVNSSDKNITKLDSPKTQLSLFDNMLQSAKITKDIKKITIKTKDNLSDNNKKEKALQSDLKLNSKDKIDSQKKIVSTNLDKLKFNNQLKQEIPKESKEIKKEVIKQEIPKESKEIKKEVIKQEIPKESKEIKKNISIGTIKDNVSISSKTNTLITNIDNIAKRLVDIVVKNKKELSFEVDNNDAKKTIENLSKSDQEKIFKNVSKKLVSIIVEDKKNSSKPIDDVKLDNTKIESKKVDNKNNNLDTKDDNLNASLEKNSSLMDTLLQQVKNDIEKEKVTNTKKDNISVKLKANTTTDEVKANIFLSLQKNDQTITSSRVVKDVKDTILSKKTLDSVEDGANILKLNPTNIDVSSSNGKGSLEDYQKAKQVLDDNIKKETKKTKEIKEQKGNIARSFLDSKISTTSTKEIMPQNIILDKTHIETTNTQIKNKNTVKDDLKAKKYNNDQEIKQEDIKISTNNTKNIQIKQNESLLEEKVININVPANEANILKNKIIGAQQRMSSLMSDVAKKMYQDYKPPVTAFRINLTPDSLGSISVVMKSNKSDNSLKVSMNMSNRSTMDVFADNKSSLQNALANNVGGDANISLDFGMQQDGGQNNQQESGFESFQSSNKTVSSKVSTDEELVDIVDPNVQSNYM